MDIGAQLWLFRSLEDESSMETVLTQMKAAGYSCLETMVGRAPRQRAVLDRLELPCYATHVALSAMPSGSELADFAHDIGAETICISGLLRWHERAADDYRRAAEALNSWGERLKAEGLALHYHNHEFEFSVVEDATTGMELLLSQCDDGLVSLCFDAGWAIRAGQDPVQFLTDNALRIGTMHLRDFRGAESVRLGAGDIDLSGIVSVLPSLPNLRKILVEQDPGTETPCEDMAASRRFLKERFDV